jgi:hypothetical protein
LSPSNDRGQEKNSLEERDMKRILVLFSVFGLIIVGCKKDENESTNKAVGEGSSIPIPTNPKSGGDSVNDPSENVVSVDTKIKKKEDFRFNSMSGTCLSEEGEKGRNYNKLGECGDLSQEKLDKVDLSLASQFKGLDLRGSD